MSCHDYVVDGCDYEDAKLEAQKATARADELSRVVNRYARHDELCHTLDRESLATHKRVCTCGLEDALATTHKAG